MITNAAPTQTPEVVSGAAAFNEATDSDTAARKNRILIVDDDPGVMAIMQAMLKTCNYAVTPASSAEQAVDLYRKAAEHWEPIDLVLLDLTLPGGMNGVEALDALRSFDPRVRVIAASGYFDDSASQGAK